MAGGDRRKCKCCLKLFRPAPRNRHHQRYCSVPVPSRDFSSPRQLEVSNLCFPDGRRDFSVRMQRTVVFQLASLYKSEHSGSTASGTFPVRDLSMAQLVHCPRQARYSGRISVACRRTRRNANHGGDNEHRIDNSGVIARPHPFRMAIRAPLACWRSRVRWRPPKDRSTRTAEQHRPKSGSIAAAPGR